MRHGRTDLRRAVRWQDLGICLRHRTDRGFNVGAPMTDLHHKRRQCQEKADETGDQWAIFTYKDDFEPKCLCDAPLRMVPAGTDIEAVLQPGTRPCA